MEVDEQSIYEFSRGLPGFEDETTFALIPWEETPFSYLQSVKEKELSFLVVSPFEFKQDYSFELSDEDKEELEIEEEVAVFSIVTIHSEITKSTMNLLAPVVINPVKRVGKQVVLLQSDYMTRHLIWTEELTTTEGGA
ncbi:flagellar assembly protein FliW [Paenibacillus polysaccharolyticus]|uniref:flagellar assembly protein FliW n=1 Tax=Paenibacillus polysaccharolyticus TaxID=582692 RepID=UPI0021BF411C|nr:flagellar assembly protein FliW [Paenibacillus polysaccharolyticus]